VSETPLALPADAEPETLAVYLETLWHLTGEEIEKVEGLQRKATALASLAGFVVAVNGSFGLSLVRAEGGWPRFPYVLSFVFLLAAVGFAVTDAESPDPNIRRQS
jgi:hypothetical protein